MTVRLALPKIEPDVAEITEEPCAKPLTSPCVGTMLLMLPTVAEDELQITRFVKSWVLPSERVPIAVNDTVVFGAIDVLDGLTPSETKAAAVTVKLADPLTLPDVAITVADPWALVVANPLLATAAIPVAEELQVTELVRSALLPSVYVP